MATNYTWIYGLDTEYKLVRWHRIPVIPLTISSLSVPLCEMNALLFRRFM